MRQEAEEAEGSEVLKVRDRDQVYLFD